MVAAKFETEKAKTRIVGT